ncbi:MAG: folate-binding protein [Chromatiales bacterium]|nr:folate-binding protein [Chromatiales bacterium]
MNDEPWKNFLTTAGAVFDETGSVRDFVNPAEEHAITGNILVPLTHLALISATGADTATFLQGQLTNDVRHIDTTHSQLSGYCSPKGRLLALLRLFQRDDRYYLQLPATLAASTVTRLSRYVLRAKVALTIDDTLVGLGLSGPQSEAMLLDTLGAAPPTAVDGVAHAGEFTVLRVAGSVSRFIIYGSGTDMRSLWTALAAKATPAGIPAWNLLDILAGLPQILPATVEEFVPQMVNLDLLNGIGFQKGCYTGQEIVARVHYRGAVKRRTYLAHTAASIAPQPGQSVSAPSSSEQVAVAGQIVSVAPAPEGGYLCLVSLLQDHARAGGLRLPDADNAPLELRDLPYLAAGAD